VKDDERKSMTGAHAIAATLRLAGVDLAFGLPGVHNMGLWPRLGEAGIRVIGSRHEQGTVYAADGYARATGRLGLALTTTGPGAANAVGAIGEAWASKVPVMLLSTDIPSSMRRPGVYRGVVHECVDQPALFEPVTKRTFVSRDPDDVAELVASAVEVALAPPRGPVYVEFPADYFDAASRATPRAPELFRAVAPSDEELRDAAALLGALERPLLWIGGGGRDASGPVDELARRLGAPVLTTFQARGVLPDDHPLLVGLPPHEPEVTALIERADGVVVIGSDLDQMMTQGWRLPLPERRLAVNVDRVDATKNYAMDVVVVGEAADVAARLAQTLPAREPWAGDLDAIARATFAELESTAETTEAVRYLKSVEAGLPEDAVVFADMAVPGYWLSGYHPVRRQRALHYPMGWGTLGYAFPASIGAAAALTAPVVSFNGDGGVLFAIGELATIAQEQIPLTLVIVDDQGYGMLRYGKETSANRFGTELASPDFATIARGFNLAARSVAGVGDEFEAALREAVASGEPNVLVARAAMTPPRTTSPRWPLIG
jgi:acetolactate synthase-1/2/3 large subunit